MDCTVGFPWITRRLVVYVGRAVFGLGIGVAMHAAPLFIAETSPSNIRGVLVSLKEAAIVLGIVLGYAAGALFGDQGNWRIIFTAVLPLELAMLLGSLYVPESPRWLARRGDIDEAIASIQRIQGINSTEASLVISSINPSSSSSSTTKPSPSSSNLLGFIEEVKGAVAYQRALTIGIGLVLFQQLTGQPSVLYFANRIFERAGLGYEAALGVGAFKLLMTLLSAGLVENPRFGRKNLLTYGSIAMTVSLALLTSLFAFSDPSDPTIQASIISCILLYVGGYQVGYGPMTWLVLSEIFPLSVRSSAVSLGTLVNFGSNLVVTLLFEAERQVVGEAVLFGQFTVVSVVATVFIVKKVFETRGLSLEDIEVKLNEVDS